MRLNATVYLYDNSFFYQCYSSRLLSVPTLLCTSLQALNNNKTQVNRLAKDTHMYFSMMWQC